MEQSEASKTSDARSAIWFLLPTIILFLVFIAYPIIYNIQASTMHWDGVNEATSAGVDNYKQIFTDPVFHITLRNSVYWIVLTIIPQSLIGFFLAVVLNNHIRGRTIYRTLFFLPVVISPVVIGIVWQRILDPFNGVVASMGRYTDIDFLTKNWLGSPDTAIFTVIFINVWMWSGYSMLFYLAGLQAIDKSVLEAARIDGASKWKTTWVIIFPLLKSTHLSLLLLSVIGSLKTFELVYVLTEGGPDHASEMIPTYTFLEAFRLQHVGYASALSVILLIIAVVTALTLVRIFGSGFITGGSRD
ncbi:MAG: sugar ABC transporter permease [Actinomycetaceae bacterium]|nr:sugar ABC transporter permease [Actinomycetaceae bacterium]